MGRTRKGAVKRKPKLTIEQYTKKITKTGKVDELIKSGYKKESYNNILNMSYYNRRGIYRRILKGQTKAEARELLTKSENINKWSKYLEYKFEAYGETSKGTDQKIGEWTLAHKTIMECI